MTRIHRRTFLQQSAAVGVALGATRVHATNVNERLNMGFIGCGGRGNELLKQFAALDDVRIAALCDPDVQRLNETAAKHDGAAKSADLRKLLDDPNVDAVAIATCNHWHALAAIWACQAGKDVYVEKPLAHNHWEGQQVVRAARKHDRVVQIGTQQRSDPPQAKLKKFLHDDQALDPIRYVQVCRLGAREPIGRRSKPLKPPKSIDYNLWLGPALDKPIYRDKLHYDWHWDWNTGNGEMGNWGVHVLDDALNVALRDRVPFPTRVAAGGGRVAWDDAGETPNVGFAYYKTGDIPVLFALSNLPDKSKEKGLKIDGVGTGYVIHCEGGYYEGGRGGGAAFDKNGKLIHHFRGDAGAGHARNFVDAVYAHDRTKLNAEVEIGHQSTAWCNLADIAIRIGQPYAHDTATTTGQPPKAWSEVINRIEQHLAENAVKVPNGLTLSPILEFDPTTEQFTGADSDQANHFLRRKYRKPFEVPTIA
ncbi:MAG: Gfo/Idh/MocA family oxidoreductase [Planctomycetes bacterium]|nr:Gfo/Idh/MocA family oxidoreductase [Planctomycetota bacterium]